MLKTKALKLGWALGTNVLFRTRLVSSASSAGTLNAQTQPQVKSTGPKAPRVVAEEPQETDWRVQQPDETKEYKPSFAKKLFVGQFDTDVLTFPEVLEKEDLETLNEMMVPIEKFFNEQGSSLVQISHDGSS
jgi:hypothetical protein